MASRADLIEYLNDEIAHLTEIRGVLLGRESHDRAISRRSSTASVSPQKRRLSAAARKRIGDAQRARWAARRGRAALAKPASGKPESNLKTLKKKRVFSAASRRKMAAAQRARWANRNK